MEREQSRHTLSASGAVHLTTSLNTDFPPVQTYLYDASYFRLKNIEVGYNFPRKWLSNLRLENVRVYVSGQNLFTITDVPQIDPENVNSQGWSYPQMKSFNAGISIQF